MSRRARSGRSSSAASGKSLELRLARAGQVALRGIEPLVPVQCAVCREPGESVCRPCRRLLHRSCSRPRRVETGAAQLGGLPVVAAGSYEFELAVCLMAFKDGGRSDLLPVLAPILARAVRAGLGEDSADQVLVPIPTSARALRRRWSDPVGELLARAGREGLLPAGARIEPWLAHRSRTAGAALHLGPAPWTGSQKTRDAAGRARAEDPFVLQRPGRRLRSPVPVSAVLVDDVLTTGSTLRRAARRLEAGGIEVRGAVVLGAVGAPSAQTARSARESPEAGG